MPTFKALVSLPSEHRGPHVFFDAQRAQLSYDPNGCFDEETLHPVTKKLSSFTFENCCTRGGGWGVGNEECWDGAAFSWDSCCGPSLDLLNRYTALESDEIDACINVMDNFDSRKWFLSKSGVPNHPYAWVGEPDACRQGGHNFAWLGGRVSVDEMRRVHAVRPVCEKEKQLHVRECSLLCFICFTHRSSRNF